MNHIIEVGRQGRTPSKIVIGDVLGQLTDFLPSKRLIIITDSNVHRRHRELIDSYENIIIGMGETNKTLHTVDRIYRELIGMNVDRECFILGFGGGIVTDIAGFAASTYMRGLDFGFVATTLLSQVDASVGGKNGVNLDGYKNMVGTFNQPEFVFCDISVLATLPQRELLAGMAEAIKSGIIADPELFSIFERSDPEEISTKKELLTDIIYRSVKVKAAIVETDEKEKGDRKKLNLGHTFAHAIEKTTDKYLHGEAVAIGICIICDFAVRTGELSSGDRDRIISAIGRTGLPTSVDIDIKRLFKALRMDKKRDTDSISLAIPTGIGDVAIKKMSFDQMESAW